MYIDGCVGYIESGSTIPGIIQYQSIRGMLVNLHQHLKIASSSRDLQFDTFA